MVSRFGPMPKGVPKLEVLPYRCVTAGHPSGEGPPQPGGRWHLIAVEVARTGRAGQASGFYPSGGRVRKALRIVGVVVLFLIVAALGFYFWASATASRKLARVYQVHTVDFPIPFPLAPEEVARRKLTPGAADSVARDEALRFRPTSSPPRPRRTSCCRRPPRRLSSSAATSRLRVWDATARTWPAVRSGGAIRAGRRQPT